MLLLTAVLALATSCVSEADNAGGSESTVAESTVATATTMDTSFATTEPPAGSAAPSTSGAAATTTSAEAGRPAGNVRPGIAADGSVSDESLITPDGRERTFRVYVPSTLPADEEVPLLLALHGGTGSGEQFESNSGFDELAEANGFIAVYPDGTEIGTLPGRVWNGGSCCGPAQESRDDVDDVGFIDTLIDRLVDSYAIDAGRVYVAGHSNGGILAYRLACELSDRIVAIGVQAATLAVDDCSPSAAVSILHIHGLADTNLPIDGGRGDGISNTDFPSPRLGIDRLAVLDGCGDPVESVDDENPDITSLTWVTCHDGAIVEMLTVDGANHRWMGHEGSQFQDRTLGESYPDLDSSFAIWTFLSARRRS